MKYTAASALLLAIFFSMCFSVRSEINIPRENTSFTLNNKTLSATQESIAASIVYEINNSFNNQANYRDCDDGKPAYYCNGVMVSAFEKGKDLYWMSSHPVDGKISLTFYRNDVAGKLWGDSGFIIWPEGVLNRYIGTVGKVYKAFKPTFWCTYPSNGNTEQRSDFGCGPFKKDTSESPNSTPCQSQGITSAEQYIQDYLNPPGKNYFCGFALNVNEKADKDIFEENVKVMKYIKDEFNLNLWNETIMKPWDNEEHQHIPLMAFFYVSSASVDALVKNDGFIHNEITPMELAQYHQEKYYELTGIFVPIVKIFNSDNKVHFEFNRDEQSKQIPEIINAFPE